MDQHEEEVIQLMRRKKWSEHIVIEELRLAIDNEGLRFGLSGLPQQIPEVIQLEKKAMDDVPGPRGNHECNGTEFPRGERGEEKNTTESTERT